MYEFQEQLDKGENGEQTLDKYYSQWFKVESVSLSAQKTGIDRVFTEHKTGIRASVEYKTDTWTPITNRVFIETVSVDTANKPGWAYTSVAQWLIYYVPEHKKAYRTSMLNIKHLLPYWLEKVKNKIKDYEHKRVPNDGYFTEGITVPLSDFIKICNGIDEGIE